MSAANGNSGMSAASEVGAQAANTSPFSVVETLSGREVLLTGASGFVGKVWLVMMLTRVPDIGRIHLLVRPNAELDSLGRVEKIVNTSPAFGPLHERYGDQLGAFLRSKIQVHEGDITKPTLGLDPAAFRGLDLVVSCAATVDFAPDTRFAVKTNIYGSMNAAEFASQCGAGLVQVSTCFVNGRTAGRRPEGPLQAMPNGEAFDPEAELASLEAVIAEKRLYHGSDAFVAALTETAIAKLTKPGDDPDPEAVEQEVRRQFNAPRGKEWRDLGTDRASARHWPNPYPYTKAIAEGLLFARYPHMSKAVVRPAVVESARSFPFEGWNEGFNTCGPLAYLIGTWFKALPGRKDNPFDVVPVDMVCEGISVAATAVLRGEAHPVYQCGTSDLNVLTIGRANELTGLGQRAWLRKNGKDVTERAILSRADTTLFEDGHLLSVENVDRAFEKATEVLRALPKRTPADVVARAKKTAFKLERKRRTLKRVRMMVDAFRPFTRDLRQTFESRGLAEHAVVEPEFVWNPKSLNWREYWLNVHMPGMRKWSFPLFEREDPPALESPHHVDLHSATEAAE